MYRLREFHKQQNGRHFAQNHFKRVFWNTNICNSIWLGTEQATNQPSSVPMTTYFNDSYIEISVVWHQSANYSTALLHIDGIVQERRNSSASRLFFLINPSTCHVAWHPWYTHTLIAGEHGFLSAKAYRTNRNYFLLTILILSITCAHDMDDINPAKLSCTNGLSS